MSFSTEAIRNCHLFKVWGIELQFQSFMIKLKNTEGEMNPLEPSETKLKGGCVTVHGKPEFDAVSQRIFWLIECRLTHLADDESGWLSLYTDSSDGRLWERSFPQSQEHGGGAPQLNLIGRELAEKRYLICLSDGDI